MPKRKNKRRAKFGLRDVFFILIVLILIAAVSFCFMYSTQQPKDDLETTEETPKENPQTSTLIENSTEEEPEIQKTPTQNEGTDPNTLEQLTGSITTAYVAGDKAIIRLNIDQFLSSGTCTLTMISGTNTYSSSAAIISDVTTSTCEGFDIPTDLLSSGVWSITIDLSSDNKTGQIIGEIEL